MLLLNPLITALGWQAIFNQKFCSRPSTLRLREKPLLSRSVIIQARKSSSIFSVSGNFFHTTSIDRASKSDLIITLIKTYYHSMLRRTVSKRRVDVPRITTQLVYLSSLIFDKRFFSSSMLTLFWSAGGRQLPPMSVQIFTSKLLAQIWSQLILLSKNSPKGMC